MKILLVGEYSRLHNSLKEGLVKLGHEVVIIGDGDSFKNYPVDLSIKPKWVNFNWFTKKLKVAFYKITRIDLQHIEGSIRFFFHQKNLKKFDVVQFINSNALKTPIYFQKRQLKFLKKHNRKLVLCACGTDTPIVQYLLDGHMKYHILTPFVKNETRKKTFKFEFNYLRPAYLKYNLFFQNLIEGFVASDMDYYLPLKEQAKCKGLIPNPINTDRISEGKISDNLSEIHIFLGINTLSEIKKGTHFFEKALEQIKEKYPSIKITICRSVPYDEYVKLYGSAHLFLDMVYAYDQGYNALEAMAKGKVVFTGAEKEFLEYYNLQEDEVCINALPDVEYLVDKLSWLIENPQKIKEIGKNARKFIEEHHDYKKIAKRYLDFYKLN